LERGGVGMQVGVWVTRRGLGDPFYHRGLMLGVRAACCRFRARAACCRGLTCFCENGQAGSLPYFGVGERDEGV
jgi:hypothetical protein